MVVRGQSVARTFADIKNFFSYSCCMYIAKRMYFTTASWRNIIRYETQASICTSRILLNEKCQNVLVAVKIVHY